MAVTGERLIYDITVNSKGASQELKDFDKSVQQLNKSTQNISKTFDVFKGVLAGYLSFQGAKAFLALAEGMQEAQTRLVILTGSMETALAVQEELFQIAQKQNVALKDLSKAYIKISPALQEQGKSQAEILKFTDALISSYKLIGQSTDEAAQSVSNLADAYASGKIDSGQLNQVLLTNRELLKAVSKELGVTEKELRKLARAGKVSGEDLFSAVTKAADEWEKKASQLPVGISEALTNLGNSLAKLATNFAPVIDVIAKGLLFIADNFEAAAVGVGVFTAALLIATGAVTGLNIALLANPVTLAAGALAAAAILIYKNWDGIKIFFLELWEVTLPNAVDEFTIFWIKFVNVITNFFKEGMNAIIEVYNNTIGKISGKKIEPFQLEFNLDEIKEINQAIEDRTLAFDKYVLSLDKVVVKTDELNKKGQVKIFGPDLTEADWAWVDEIWNVGDAMDALAERTENLKEQLRGLQENDPFGGFQIGIQQAIAEVPTLTESFAKLGQDLFKDLTKSLSDFVKTGKLEMKDLFNSIIDGLIQIGIQKALVAAIGNVSSEGGGGLLGLLFAKGGVFKNSEVTPFAKGGVVDKPTIFPFAGGVGLMSERGAEAIMPLHRDSSGSLGVKSAGQVGSSTQVNVYNQTNDSDVETKESTDPNGMKKIDVYIKTKIKSVFASGEMDRTMSTSFGLSRSGSR